MNDEHLYELGLNYLDKILLYTLKVAYTILTRNSTNSKVDLLLLLPIRNDNRV